MKALLFFFLFLISSPELWSSEVNYFKVANGDFKIITLEEFNRCEKVIYRKEASEQLSIKHKKKLLRAILQGKAIKSLKFILREEGSCSYKTDSEKI